MVLLSKSVYTSLAARYWNSRWSQNENAKRYGELASSEGVGGNWRIEIGGPVSESELEAPLKAIKALLDHRCLFVDLPEFADKASTLEAVTQYLGQKFLDERFRFLTVHETDRLACTVDGAGMRIEFDVMNLRLTIKGVPDESGLIFSRELVTQSVKDTHAEFTADLVLSEIEWSRSLLENLRRRVPGLHSLRVDLGRGKYIVVE